MALIERRRIELLLRNAADRVNEAARSRITPIVINALIEKKGALKHPAELRRQREERAL